MNLFAYGTLLIPEIWHLAAGCGCLSEEATLPGYEIRRVAGAEFPGIRRGTGDVEVPGRVFLNLAPAVMARLDAYEADFYERTGVTVRTGRGEVLAAQAYVVPASRAEVLSEEGWSLDWFRREAFAKYRARLRGRA